MIYSARPKSVKTIVGLNYKRVSNFSKEIFAIVPMNIPDNTICLSLGSLKNRGMFFEYAVNSRANSYLPAKINQGL